MQRIFVFDTALLGEKKRYIGNVLLSSSGPKRTLKQILYVHPSGLCA